MPQYIPREDDEDGRLHHEMVRTARVSKKETEHGGA